MRMGPSPEEYYKYLLRSNDKMIEIQYTKTDKDLCILLEHYLDFGKHIMQKVNKHIVFC